MGDVEANATLALEAIVAAADRGADLVLLPELAISGYPPEDLLLRGDFLDACAAGLAEVAAEVPEGIVALVGCPLRDLALHNALAVLADGQLAAVYNKVHLPNYGVFDERRYFEPGQTGAAIVVNDARLGLTICEDIWDGGPPASEESRSGVDLIVNASASPYHRAKGSERETIIARCATENRVAVALCNMVGGQDELVFDGESLVVGPDGETIARGAQFEADLVLCDLNLPADADADAADRGSTEPGRREGASGSVPLIFESRLPKPDRPALPRGPVGERLAPVPEVYAALVLGLRDYMGKNGFDRAVLGLSGGIDSALVALLAADAIGPGAVSCVVMPSPHSGDDTQNDARRIASNLGCEPVELPIGSLMATYEGVLAPSFAGTQAGVSEENLQARIRGNLVMALSNKFGWLPLSTGNKSEMSVGYTTLYGDMAGGFAVIKDVPKQLVYELTLERNRRAGRDLVPASVIERPPTAELRPGQRDSDALPPYEALDRALEIYVAQDGSRAAMIAAGIAPEVASRVADLVDGAEYKRRQAPPGPRISTKAFGRDRRLPITNGWRG